MAETILPFTNCLPVRIRFGEGVALQLCELLADIEADRVMVVLDEDIERHNPAVATVLRNLEEGKAEVTRMEKPAGEPTIAMIDATTRGIRGSRADAVIAIGGGSVIDTAKAARLCVQAGCTFGEFLESARAYPAPIMPLIAVPTTAGTGSEVSGGAVVTEPDSGRKAGIAHPHLRPQHAVVDPRLSWSMPPNMTANTGVDALAQAIAAMVAKVRTPIGDAIALEAIRMMGTALSAAYHNGGDEAARSNMACGSMMAGLAMNISDCTAEHSLGQAIGGLTGAPHGLTVGLVLAETLERERRFVPEQLERVADALGVPGDDRRNGSRAVAGVRSLLAQLDFPVLAGLGVTEDHLDVLTDLAVEDYFMTMTPHPWDRREVRAALEHALSCSRTSRHRLAEEAET